MKILITGATGLIGRRLVEDRLNRGDELVVVSRSARRAQEALGASVRVVEADPKMSGPWQRSADGCDAIVHLAGASVADRRWSRAYKQEIIDSRIESTSRIVEAIAAAAHRPQVLVNASAVGFYGDRGDESLDESAAPGEDFLARLAVDWEAAARRAEKSGVRVVLLRTGIVLDDRGGALRGMLPAFRMMLGGPVGSGRQYWPWIHWRDVVGLIGLSLRDEGCRGPLNLAAPEPATCGEFARALGSVLHRPAFLPMPVWALRVVLGELARYVAASTRVIPAAALARGYEFAHPKLRPALASLVG
jgi:uncharacterized protein (TIGR01777 family)